MIDLRLERADWLLTLDGDRRILTDGAVDVEGGRIAAVGKTGEVRRRGPAARVIDSYMSVPPRSFAPVCRHSAAPFGPILTHDVWILRITGCRRQQGRLLFHPALQLRNSRFTANTGTDKCL